MDSKTRATLRALANKIKPTVIIGKEGLSENVLKQIDTDLSSHELVKVSVLEDDLDYKSILNDICEKVNAEGICAIGKKLVLYRYSSRKGVKHVLEVK